MTERTVLVLNEEWGDYPKGAELHVLDPAAGDLLERGPDGIAMVARTAAGEPIPNAIDQERGAQLLTQGLGSKVETAAEAEKPASRPAAKRGGKAKG